MKKRGYWLTYQINEEEKIFNVEINTRTGKCVHRTSFSRNGMTERVLDYQFYLAVSNPKQFAIQIYPQKLNEADKNRIHVIFPYIPQFTDLKEFAFWYNKCNVTFSYERHNYIEKCMNHILQMPKFEADGIWKCMGFPTDNYLYCKWIDLDEKVHTVIVDDKMFVSDLDYSEICRQEKSFVVGDISEIKPFAEVHSKTLLDIYLEKGGTKIFSFLTASKMNHPMELLGKAGLAKLADNMESFEGINYAGTNFNNIFGVPLMVLKALENGQYEMLCTVEDREVLAKAFRENRAVFTEPMTEIGEMWLRYYYLNQGTLFSMEGSGKFPGNLAATIRYLNQMCSNGENIYNVFGLYQNYIAYGLRIEKFVDGVYPKDLEKAVAQEIDILQKRYEAEKVRMFQKIVEKPEYKYLEENLPDNQYKVETPKSAEDLVLAGEKLHNCLGSIYIGRIKKGLAKIVFLYDKKEELVGAIEICEDRVVQALGNCNKRLSEEVWDYLKGYMQRKNLRKDLLYHGWGM